MKVKNIIEAIQQLKANDPKFDYYELDILVDGESGYSASFDIEKFAINFITEQEEVEKEDVEG